MSNTLADIRVFIENTQSDLVWVWNFHDIFLCFISFFFFKLNYSINLIALGSHENCLVIDSFINDPLKSSINLIRLKINMKTYISVQLSPFTNIIENTLLIHSMIFIQNIIQSVYKMIINNFNYYVIILKRKNTIWNTYTTFNDNNENISKVTWIKTTWKNVVLKKGFFLWS